MDEQTLEQIARAIYAAEWANTPDPSGDYDGYVAEYCGDENPYLDLARAAHSVMAGKVAELTEALEAIADHAAQLRKGTDDWFEMVEFEHIARAALAPHPKGME